MPENKKPHWTQTPEGKARLKRLTTASWSKRGRAKRAKRANQSPQPPEEHVSAKRQPKEIQRHLSYALGHVEAWLGIYADRIGVSRADFTGWVALALQSQAMGQRMGPDNQMPPL